MLIKNAAALLGPDLAYEGDVHVRVNGGVFGSISPRLRPEAGEEVVDCEGLLMLPGFVNCHTHLGDSVAKDVALGTGVEGRVHPVYGVKSRVLARTGPDHLSGMMRASCLAMLSGGITTFVDFREGGPAGAGLLRKACSGIPIRTVILGRPDRYQNDDQVASDGPPPPEEDVKELLTCCDGLGISGANENSDSTLARYAETAKIRAIHAAESAESVAKSVSLTGRGEVGRALQMRPHFLVHMTRATPDELRAVAPKTGIVACPRANAALSGTIPDIPLMLRCGCTVALGTDNVMVNPPDMFREMDFAWKAAGGGGRLDPVDVLRMATVNGGSVLGADTGVIRERAAADYILIDEHHIDLEPMHDPHAAVVHRASSRSIRAVAVGGRVVHGDV